MSAQGQNRKSKTTLPSSAVPSTADIPASAGDSAMTRLVHGSKRQRFQTHYCADEIGDKTCIQRLRCCVSPVF
jgi:hypothetical protein